MNALMRNVDTEADRFDRTEKRLDQWGAERRKHTQAMGMPTVSNFAQIAAHVRRQEREARKERKRNLRKKLSLQRKHKQPIDCKEQAQADGDADLELTAQGKPTRSMRAPVAFSSSAITVEAAVRSLPDWMQAPLIRTYVFQQPHRIAAREMRMDEPAYRARWRAAVDEVGRVLAMREAGAVRSASPSRAG